MDVIQHIMTDRIWEWDDRCRLMRSGIVVLDTGIILVRSLPTNIIKIIIIASHKMKCRNYKYTDALR